MNITFLVGNGFDLSAGMKTSYHDFYEWYVKQPSDLREIQTFKEEIKRSLNEGSEDSRWSDFEAALGEYTKGKSFDEFRKIYDDARDGIMKYLREERNRYFMPCDPVERISSFCQGILEFYQELGDNEKNSIEGLIRDSAYIYVNFISFNYTDCLDLCIASAARQLKNSNSQFSSPRDASIQLTRRNWTIQSSVIHAHGTVDDYPVLGVSDSSQVANEELRNWFGFPELMIKSRSDAATGQNRFAKVETRINRSQIICVWGMSLGKTDSFWWERIADWLIKDNNRHLILFWYKNRSPNPYTRYVTTEEAKNSFLSNTKLLQEDKERIKDRIYVVWNTNKVLKTSFKLRKN